MFLKILSRSTTMQNMVVLDLKLANLLPFQFFQKNHQKCPIFFKQTTLYNPLVRDENMYLDNYIIVYKIRNYAIIQPCLAPSELYKCKCLLIGMHVCDKVKILVINE